MRDAAATLETPGARSEPIRDSDMIKVAQVDAVLDSVSDDESPAGALADLLDEKGDWDWSDDSEHDPSDRLAVLESSGAYWLVYRGAECDAATRFASYGEAQSALADARHEVLA
jgi:hypothetical protein